MGWEQFVAQFFQAGNTIMNPNGLFIYSGAPAAGNLIYSNANLAGTDAFGNTYLGSLSDDFSVTYSNAAGVACAHTSLGIQFYNFTAQPGAVFTAASALFYSAGSTIMQFQGTSQLLLGLPGAIATLGTESPNGVLTSTPADGMLYRLGVAAFNSNAVAISAVTFTALEAMGPFIAGGSYTVHIRIGYTGAQAAGNPKFGWHGGGAPPASFGWTIFDGAPGFLYRNTVPGDATGPVLTVGDHVYDTYLRFTAAATGSFTLAAATTIAGDAFTVQFCDVEIRALS